MELRLPGAMFFFSEEPISLKYQATPWLRMERIFVRLF